MPSKHPINNILIHKKNETINIISNSNHIECHHVVVVRQFQGGNDNKCKNPNNIRSGRRISCFQRKNHRNNAVRCKYAGKSDSNK